MKSIVRLSAQSAALPVLADDIVEFHAARILLLLRICGTAGRIKGLTKIAKLDFLVRYPEFFNRIAAYLKAGTKSELRSQESSMVRLHYGPWDRRYYHTLAYLEARSLILVSKRDSAFIFELTALGKSAAMRLQAREEFSQLSEHMQQIKKVFKSYSGYGLKKLIYQVFKDEISNKAIGRTIE